MSVILVIEPHPLLRLGILQLMSELSPQIMVEGADYPSFGQNTVARPDYDLALLSIAKPDGMGGLITSVRQLYSPRAILLLSEHDDMHYENGSICPLVAGHVTKHAPPEVLKASVKLVLAGGTCFPGQAARAGRPGHISAGMTVPHSGPAATPPSPLARGTPAGTDRDKADTRAAVPGETQPECKMLGLTPRQYEVLVLLARGYPMKLVGRSLNISLATAKAHTEALYQRLNVHNRNAAVYAAVSRGATLGWPSIATAARQAQELLATHGN